MSPPWYFFLFLITVLMQATRFITLTFDGHSVCKYWCMTAYENILRTAEEYGVKECISYDNK